jgi:hypothetical protein
MHVILGQVSGFCDHGNEISGSIKGREFLDCLSDCQLVKKGSGPWEFILKQPHCISFLLPAVDPKKI